MNYSIPSRLNILIIAVCTIAYQELHPPVERAGINESNIT